MKQIKAITFLMKMFIRTKQGQEFIVGQKTIAAINYDAALKIFRNSDLPFHHFSTVETIS